MAFDLLAGFVVLQIPHRPNMKLNVRMGFHRKIFKTKLFHTVYDIENISVVQRWELWPGPSCRVTASCQRHQVLPGRLRSSEKIHISEESKKLLDKVGGFRCDYRGTLELGVTELKIF